MNENAKTMIRAIWNDLSIEIEQVDIFLKSLAIYYLIFIL